MNTMRRNLIGCLATMCLASMWLPGIAWADNPLLESLFRRGVPVGPKETVALPKPTLADGLSAPEQRKIVEKLIDQKYSWEAFTRKSVVTPFVIKISDNEADSAGVGRRVDLWFVAYGELKTLESDDFLNARFQSSGGARDEDAMQAKLLNNADLSARRLKPPASAADPRYVAAETSLFEKIRVSATTRNVKTATAESVVVASMIDQDFDDDREFPNRWRPITRDTSGRRQLGEPLPYFGLGAYVKATALAEPAGALLIEYHVAFAEPEGWFHGANLLRSKLPIVAQDGVRRFRRSLAEK